MANEERLKGPNTPQGPDTADEVQRRTVAPTPQQPTAGDLPTARLIENSWRPPK